MMNDDPFAGARPDCVWWRGAAPTDLDLPRLDGDLDVDTVVIGAGYTGLSTALHLAGQGAAVAVLEVEFPGFGASGRNGGQVQAGSKMSTEKLRATYGTQRGRLIEDIADAAADFLYSTIRTHRISCDATENGVIRCIPFERSVDQARAEVAAQASKGADIRIADREETRSLVGGGDYHAAIVDRRGGSIDPFAYVVGLCRAVMSAGGKVYARSPVTAIGRSGERWLVSTANGNVTARNVAICTNGYSGSLLPRLARSIIPVNSFQIATEPLGDAGRFVIPGREVVTETRKLLFYYRRDREGRLIIGGRGFLSGERDPRRYGFLRRQMVRLYPQLRHARIETFWAGRVAVTMGPGPHVHEPEPGLFALLGYNGRGVALSTILGARLAQRILGAPQEVMGFPVEPVRPIPFWRWHTIAQPFMINAYRISDRLK